MGVQHRLMTKRQLPQSRTKIWYRHLNGTHRPRKKTLLTSYRDWYRRLRRLRWRLEHQASWIAWPCWPHSTRNLRPTANSRQILLSPGQHGRCRQTKATRHPVSHHLLCHTFLLPACPGHLLYLTDPAVFFPLHPHPILLPLPWCPLPSPCQSPRQSHLTSHHLLHHPLVLRQS